MGQGDLRNFISVYPNVIEDTWCESLIGDWDNFSRPPNEDVCRYDMNLMGLRNDSLLCLDLALETDSPESTALKLKYYKKAAAMVMKYAEIYNNDELGSVLPKQELEGMQLQKSEAERSGGFYSFHSERGGTKHFEKEADPMRRMLVWMLYLNDIPEGEGETEFLYQKLRIQPKKGDLVIWPAMFTHTHRGNPVYTKDKFILTGWLSWPEQQFSFTPTQ